MGIPSAARAFRPAWNAAAPPAACHVRVSSTSMGPNAWPAVARVVPALQTQRAYRAWMATTTMGAHVFFANLDV